MGATNKTTSRETTPSSHQPKDLLTDWEPIHRRDVEATDTSSGASPSLPQPRYPISAPRLSTNPPPGTSTGWHLPLQVLSLDHNDSEIPLSFLNVYPAILRKFPGPPCEALARCITYLQALFTESPGFHPYITHLPSTSIPTDEASGRHVAELLERKLIRITQHLFQFFFGDIRMVHRYIESCPVDLIPRPRFIISAKVPEGCNQSIPMLYGVDGFNNGIPNGAKLWQNPVPHTPWRIQQEKIALESNLSKIAIALLRRQPVNNKPQPPQVQPPLPPPKSLPQVHVAPFPPRPLTKLTPCPSTAAPIVRPPQHLPRAPAPSPPQVFHAPMQTPAMQQPSPLPSAPRVIPPAPPVNMPPPPPAPRVDPLREDIARLEAQVAKLTAMVDSRK